MISFPRQLISLAVAVLFVAFAMFGGAVAFQSLGVQGIVMPGVFSFGVSVFLLGLFCWGLSE